MPTGRHLDIGGLAQRVFVGVQASFEMAGVELPCRRAIVGGQVEQNAWDCDCFLVGMGGINPGSAPGLGGRALRSGDPMSSMGVRYVSFAVQVVRKEPPAPQRGTRGPAVDILTESGLALMRDAGILSQALVDLCVDIARDLPATQCDAGAVTSVGPDGDMVAVQASISMTAGLAP